ncbi:hypothetical protein, partial [Jiangella rhizosphaerae]
MSEEREVVKFYTRARRFPHVLGRFPDGTKIPGGPYTLTQVVGAGLLFLVGVRTMGIWGVGSGLTNVAFLLLATIGSVNVLGRLQTGGRGPVAVALGGYTAAASPKLGRQDGRAVTRRRPRALVHRFVIADPATPSAPDTQIVTGVPTAAASVPAPMTGIQAALASAA